MSEPGIPPIEGAHLPTVHTPRTPPDIDRIKAQHRTFKDAGMLKFA